MFNKKQKLEELFREFPGVGPRQAGRFVHSLLYKNKSYLQELAKLISEIKDSVERCQFCNRFFEQKTNESVCLICNNQNRYRQNILILEKNTDFENIEKNNLWDGLYFLIGKNLKLTEKNPENKINLNALLKQIENNPIKEIVFALSLTPEGEHSKEFLINFLQKIIREKNIKISELGRGLSLGLEIEYSDKITLAEALKNRK